MGVYTMLTDIGLSEIFTAQPGGALIEVAYWVGAFDRQLYDDFNNPSIPTSALNISAYTTPQDLYPNYSYGTGQAVSGVDRYDPVNTVYWNSAAPDNWNIPDPKNLYTNVSYMHVADNSYIRYRGYWDASTGQYPVDDLRDGDYWIISDSGTIYGDIYSTNDKMGYNGSDFTNGSDDKYRGNFKVIVSDPNKQLYVNKLGIYGIKRSVDGTIQNAEIFLLGQVIIPDAQFINPFGGDVLAIDQLIVDFQLDAKSAQIDFNNIMFASSADYWERVTINDSQYGLQYDGTVFITNTLSTEDLSYNFPTPSDVGISKLFVSTFETLNKPNPTEEQDLPQLALQYVESKNYPAQTGSGFAPRIRTTFRTNAEGNCEIDLYGACSNEFDYYALIPKEDNSFGVGNYSNRWKNIVGSDFIQLYTGDKFLTNDNQYAIIDVVNTSNVIITSGSNVCFVANQNNSAYGGYPQVAESFVGTNTIGIAMEEIPPYSGTNTEPYKIKVITDGRWYFIDSSVSSDNTYNAEYTLGSIPMYGNVAEDSSLISVQHNDLSYNDNLGLGYFGNASIYVGPHYDTRDLENGLRYKENYYYTYGNISNYTANIIDSTGNTTSLAYPLNIRSSMDIVLIQMTPEHTSKYENKYLSDTTWDAGAMSIDNEIWNMVYYGSNTFRSQKGDTEWLKAFTGTGNYYPTIFDSFFRQANFQIEKSTWTTLDDVKISLYGSVSPSGDATDSTKGLGADIQIASSRYIYTFGEILPMIDGFNNLGSWNHNFAELHVEKISGGNKNLSSISFDPTTGKDIDDNRNVIVDANLYPNYWYHSIKRDPNTGLRWYEINCQTLGNDTTSDKSDWIDVGYIKNINVTNINVNESILINNNMLLTGSSITGPNINFGTPDVRISKIYVDYLDINAISGLSFEQKTITTTIQTTDMTTSTVQNVNSFNKGSSLSNLNVIIIYSITGVVSIECSITEDALNMEVAYGDATKDKGARGIGTFNNVFNSLKTQISQIPELTNIYIPWDDFMSYSNRSNDYTSQGHYDRYSDWNDVQYDGSTFINDYISFIARKNDRNNTHSQSVNFTGTILKLVSK